MIYGFRLTIGGATARGFGWQAKCASSAAAPTVNYPAQIEKQS
jgi:hypothetical protein